MLAMSQGSGSRTWGAKDRGVSPSRHLPCLPVPSPTGAVPAWSGSVQHHGTQEPPTTERRPNARTESLTPDPNKVLRRATAMLRGLEPLPDTSGPIAPSPGSCQVGPARHAHTGWGSLAWQCPDGARVPCQAALGPRIWLHRLLGDPRDGAVGHHTPAPRTPTSAGTCGRVSGRRSRRGARGCSPAGPGTRPGASPCRWVGGSEHSARHPQPTTGVHRAPGARDEAWSPGPDGVGDTGMGPAPPALLPVAGPLGLVGLDAADVVGRAAHQPGHQVIGLSLQGTGAAQLPLAHPWVHPCGGVPLPTAPSHQTQASLISRNSNMQLVLGGEAQRSWTQQSNGSREEAACSCRMTGGHQVRPSRDLGGLRGVSSRSGLGSGQAPNRPGEEGGEGQGVCC